MNASSAKLLVLTGEKFACVKIIGRANFNSGIDFKTLTNQLLGKGYRFFVLELSECVLMDSTFLGVLAGFGLKMNQTQNQAATCDHAIELLNPTPRITDLLENLGILHLFKLAQGPLTPPEATESSTHDLLNHSKEEVTRGCLEAHLTLMGINPENALKFKDVAAFLAEDLKKSKANSKCD